MMAELSQSRIYIDGSELSRFLESNSGTCCEQFPDTTVYRDYKYAYTPRSNKGIEAVMTIGDLQQRLGIVNSESAYS